jgi:hypothetical protein
MISANTPENFCACIMNACIDYSVIEKNNLFNVGIAFSKICVERALKRLYDI